MYFLLFYLLDYSRFDTEMKKMEEEMNKFRGELISRESDNFRKTSARYKISMKQIQILAKALVLTVN